MVEFLPKALEKLHHAYCLEGETKFILPALRQELFSSLGVTTAHNPDFWELQVPSFSIAHARELINRQARKGFGGDPKFFVVATSAIQTEAQNALLKVFEEPTPKTHFFLIIPTAQDLLPTLRSRLQIIRPKFTPDSALVGEAKEFLSQSPAKRLVFIKENLLIPVSEGGRERARQFLNDLERELLSLGRPISPERARILSELASCRDFLSDRAPSLKLILEHLALVIPKVYMIKCKL